jgi:glutamine synthetase
MKELEKQSREEHEKWLENERRRAEELAKKHNAAKECGDILKVARSYAEVVLPHMEATRTIADQIEPLLGEEYKPFPSYEDLLFVKS